jgi:hypothetical protein
MASGHMNRVKRPDTWLHRPMLQNVKKALANPEPSTHDPKGTSTDRMAVDDYAALGSRLSIRLRSASKSMGLVSSASAPPANAFRSVSASP